MLGLAGCVTVESTLRSDGSATLEMRYTTQPDATEFLERRRFTSPHVTVDSVKIYEDQTTVLRASVDDATKLSTAEGFALVEVTRAPEGDDERLTITLAGPKPTDVKPDSAPWLTIAVTLPGPVHDANRHAAITGSRVAWTISKGDYRSQAPTTFSVRYTPTLAPDARDRHPRLASDTPLPYTLALNRSMDSLDTPASCPLSSE